MSKYIQSFYQYPVTFSSIEKTFPAREADGEMRNLAEISDQDLEKLQNSEPFFRALIRQKKYRILNHIPESYKPASAQINEARDEAAAARQEADELRAKLAEYEKSEPAENQTEPEVQKESAENNLDSLSYKELQDRAKEAGIEYKNVKKSDLIAALSK